MYGHAPNLVKSANLYATHPFGSPSPHQSSPIRQVHTTLFFCPTKIAPVITATT